MYALTLVMFCDMYDGSGNSAGALYRIGPVNIERSKNWVNFCLEGDGKYIKVAKFIGSVYKSMI